MQAKHQLSGPKDNLPTVGRYELVAELACGAMGVVYLCRHAGDAGVGRLFALKMSHEHLARNVEFSAMFLDEARIASRIHHHNVVSVIDFGSHKRRQFAVMEYVDGCSFDELLSRNPDNRPPHLIVPIVIGMLNGLHAAHTLEDDDGKPLGLIHRDVAPQNVLIGSDGVAQITDFGVAKASGRVSFSRPGTLKGTLAYATPEQLHQHGGIDHRVDIFAAGAVLWTALTGESLFGGDSEARTVDNVLHKPIRPPSLVGLRPPDCWDGIVLRALNRDPKERFASAAEMAKALRQTAVDHGLLGSPNEIAEWVQTSFAEELDARRAAIRNATRDHADSLLDVPVLPAIAQDATPFPQVARGAETIPAAPKVTAPTPEVTRDVLATIPAVPRDALPTIPVVDKHTAPTQASAQVTLRAPGVAKHDTPTLAATDDAPASPAEAEEAAPNSDGAPKGAGPPPLPPPLPTAQAGGGGVAAAFAKQDDGVVAASSAKKDGGVVAAGSEKKAAGGTAAAPAKKAEGAVAASSAPKKVEARPSRRAGPKVRQVSFGKVAALAGIAAIVLFAFLRGRGRDQTGEADHKPAASASSQHTSRTAPARRKPGSFGPRGNIDEHDGAGDGQGSVDEQSKTAASATPPVGSTSAAASSEPVAPSAAPLTPPVSPPVMPPTKPKPPTTVPPRPTAPPKPPPPRPPPPRPPADVPDLIESNPYQD